MVVNSKKLYKGDNSQKFELIQRTTTKHFLRVLALFESIVFFIAYDYENMNKLTKRTKDVFLFHGNFMEISVLPITFEAYDNMQYLFKGVVAGYLRYFENFQFEHNISENLFHILNAIFLHSIFFNTDELYEMVELYLANNIQFAFNYFAANNAQFVQEEEFKKCQAKLFSKIHEQLQRPEQYKLFLDFYDDVEVELVINKKSNQKQQSKKSIKIHETTSVNNDSKHNTTSLSKSTYTKKRRNIKQRQDLIIKNTVVSLEPVKNKSETNTIVVLPTINGPINEPLNLETDTNDDMDLEPLNLQTDKKRKMTNMEPIIDVDHHMEDDTTRTNTILCNDTVHDTPSLNEMHIHTDECSNNADMINQTINEDFNYGDIMKVINDTITNNTDINSSPSPGIIDFDDFNEENFMFTALNNILSTNEPTSTDTITTMDLNHHMTALQQLLTTFNPNEQNDEVDVVSTTETLTEHNGPFTPFNIKCKFNIMKHLLTQQMLNFIKLPVEHLPSNFIRIKNLIRKIQRCNVKLTELKNVTTSQTHEQALARLKSKRLETLSAPEMELNYRNGQLSHSLTLDNIRMYINWFLQSLIHSDISTEYCNSLLELSDIFNKFETNTSYIKHLLVRRLDNLKLHSTNYHNTTTQLSVPQCTFSSLPFSLDNTTPHSKVKYPRQKICFQPWKRDFRSTKLC